MSHITFKDKYIESLELHCETADALRNAEEKVYAASREITALKSYILGDLLPLLASNNISIPVPLPQMLGDIHIPLYSAPHVSPPSNGQDSDRKPVEVTFDLPPPLPMKVDGVNPNLLRLRAWTDVVRAKYSTFRRTNAAMSKAARDYLHERGITDYISSTTSERASRAVHAVPEWLVPEFLTYMDGLFLKKGLFGDQSCHKHDASNR